MNIIQKEDLNVMNDSHSNVFHIDIDVFLFQ